MRQLRDLLLVARFDLGESVRSRRAIVLLLLYAAGSVAAAALFIEVLREIENAVAEKLSVAATEAPGAMTGALLQSEELLQVLSNLIGDAALARELLTVPPLALFYGWVAFLLVPVLVILTSAESIAAELGSGSCRFALTRTDRASWAVGKLVGQSALLALGISVGAVGVWAVGLARLSSFDAVGTALWLLRLSARAWVHGFAWLGLCLGISQLTRSVHWARGLSLIVFIGGVVLGNLLQSPLADAYIPVIGPTLATLYPGSHRLDLWRPDLFDRLPAIVFLLSFGGASFTLGHQAFARRDA